MTGVPPKLFSLFTPEPPKQQQQQQLQEQQKTTINSQIISNSTLTLSASSSTTVSTDTPDSSDVKVEVKKLKAVSNSEGSTTKRKRIINSDEGEYGEKDETVDGNSGGNINGEIQSIGVEFKSNDQDLNEGIALVESNKEVEESSTRVSKGKGKEVVVLSDDDDILIIESPSSSATSSRSKPSNSKSESFPKRRKINSSSSNKASTSSLSNIIVIPDSPPANSSPLFSISRGTGTGFLPLSEIYRTSRERRIANEPIEVRWPNRDEHGNQHVNLSTNRNAERERWSSFRGKGKGKEIDAGEDEKFQLLESLTFILPHASSKLTTPLKLDNPPSLYYHPLHLVKTLLPNAIPAHPLLNRLAAPFLVDHPFPSSFIRIHDRDNDEVMSQEGSSKVNFKDMWTVKYAPKSASEVLGTRSGESAKLLKAWVEELALANEADDGIGEKKRKPRKINREVKPKRRKASDEDEGCGWIVDYDDEEDEELLEPSDTEDNAEYAPKQIERLHRITFPTLSNLILLVGPSSSGKTSAVQAVANGLGWDIFEVYPGLGKRSAKDIERYVGDVGKNHLVVGGSSEGKRKDPFSFFKSTKAPSTTLFGNETNPQEEAPPVVQKTRQSLILFDEVDIVYREDKEFWAGIVSLAKECKRPIILTCNELSNVPDYDIFQEIVRNEEPESYLQFETPESSIVIPFLQLVSLTEGHILPESTLSDLYNSRSKPEPTPTALLQCDGRFEPRFTILQESPQPDLRRALTQLQFDSQWALGNSAIAWMDFTPNRNGRTAWSASAEVKVEGEKVGKIEVEQVKEEDALAREVLATEALSHSDAYISTRSTTIIEDFEPEMNVNHADTAINFAKPIAPPLSHSVHQLPLVKSTSSLSSYLTTSAFELRQELFNASIDKIEDVTMKNQLDATHINTRRVVYDSFLVDPTKTFSTPSDLNTYYLPCFRSITTVDDLKKTIHDSGGGEVEEDQPVVGAGRGLRRSTRFGNVFRWNIEWEEGLVELVRASGFSES